MATKTATGIFILALVIAARANQREGNKRVQLFNGRDLSGWTHYLWDSLAKDNSGDRLLNS